MYFPKRIAPILFFALTVAPAGFAGSQAFRGCRVMRANSNGRLVYPFAANYFAVETRSDQFFFEHVPGTTEEYHIYDSGGMFMGSESSGLVARHSQRSDATRWRVENFGPGQTLRSVVHGRFLQTDPTGLFVRTNESRDSSNASWEAFALAPAGGCAAPPSDEPSTNTTAVTETFSGRTPVRGFADLHVHQFFDRAFGGVLAHGKAASPNGIKDALKWCDFENGLIVHGVNHASDFVGLALEQGRQLPGGWPGFEGWPRWSSVNHQQVYYKWLERAHLGGLRLMTVLAVNNELLCNAEPVATARANKLDCNDMNSVDRQIQAAKDMEEFIDDLSGGPGLGWYRIAYSSQQARSIINSGKLAVVLGIEVSNLFNCNRGTCTTAQVDQQLDHYYNLGVRQVLPVHVFNNDFAGTAMFSDFTNLGNALVNGRGLEPFDCSSQGFGYKFTFDPIAAGFFNALSGLFNGIQLPGTSSFAADCNVRGLTQPGPNTTTANGAHLLRRLMDKKMIIDIDHLSFMGREAALSMVESRPMFGGFTTGYPVISSHGEPVGAMRTPASKREAGLTDSQIQRIARLGGLIAPHLIPKLASDTNQFPSPVINDCAQSSKVFAQRYLYLRNRLAAAGQFAPAIAFGSDLNGFAAHLAPRFGAEACAPGSSTIEGNAPQSNPVAYPFNAHGKAGSFSRQVTGTRAFDYNNDGLAHIGLYPDFIQDLKNIGLVESDLDPVFRSAEGYLRVWEKAEELDFTAPTITPTVTGVQGNAGWYRSDVAVSWTVNDPESGVRSSSGCQAVTITADTAGTTFTCNATNGAGGTAQASVTIKLDKTVPAISCAAPSPTWSASDVSRACTANDPMSGLVAASNAAFALSTTVPDGTETANAQTGSRTVCDVAGNCATAGPLGANPVDKKPPTISIVSPVTGNYLVNQTVLANYGCADGGSGVASCVGTLANGAAIPTGSTVSAVFTVAARDNVNRTAAASVPYNVTNNVCLLYDPTREFPGAVAPIRLQLCDVNKAPLPSTPVLTAVQVRSGAAVFPANAQGNQGPEFQRQGGSYGFTLSTGALSPGSYELVFTVSGDPVPHVAPFVIR